MIRLLPCKWWAAFKTYQRICDTGWISLLHDAASYALYLVVFHHFKSHRILLLCYSHFFLTVVQCLNRLHKSADLGDMLSETYELLWPFHLRDASSSFFLFLKSQHLSSFRSLLDISLSFLCNLIPFEIFFYIFRQGDNCKGWIWTLGMFGFKCFKVIVLWII